MQVFYICFMKFCLALNSYKIGKERGKNHVSKCSRTG